MTEEHPLKPNDIVLNIEQLRSILQDITLFLFGKITYDTKQRSIGAKTTPIIATDHDIEQMKRFRLNSVVISNWLVDNEKPQLMAYFLGLTKEYKLFYKTLGDLEKLGLFDRSQDINNEFCSLINDSENTIRQTIEYMYPQFLPEWNKIHSPAPSATTGNDHGENQPAEQSKQHADGNTPANEVRHDLSILEYQGKKVLLPKGLRTKNVHNKLMRAIEIEDIELKEFIKDGDINCQLISHFPSKTQLTFFFSYICKIEAWTDWEYLFPEEKSKKGRTPGFRNIFDSIREKTNYLDKEMLTGREEDGKRIKWMKQMVDRYKD